MTGSLPPNAGQLVLLGGSIAALLVGASISLARWGRPDNQLRLAAKAMAYVGICLALAALIWHAADRRSWVPLEDSFETLTALGVMLAIFTLYVQRARPLPGLDWFLMPIVILMLCSAAVFGWIKPGRYRADSVWSFVHVASSFGGAAAFAIAAAVGCQYLVVSARLRNKQSAPGPNLGNLERLENFTYWAVSFGFALLSLGMVTGLLKVMKDGSNTALGPHWMASPKVILAFGVWLVYALAMHTPITPAIRGRKSAMLSIVGFVLMFATMVAVQFMPQVR
jgi:ABC-type uncharacterized transport system permease subunit